MKQFRIISLLSALLISTFSVSYAAADLYPWITVRDSSACIAGRFSPPPGFRRVEVTSGSFGRWLRHLPLKPGSQKVYLHNGRPKLRQDVHAAVLDIDTGARNLQQCADAVIRLRAEYLFAIKRYNDIRFNFTSGDTARYPRWRDGLRPEVEGDEVSWEMVARPDSTYRGFRKYLDTVFTYAGSYSLKKELISVTSLSDMRIGDIFIQGGFPGHAVIVVDAAERSQTGEKVFLLAQSYMPAQDIHILINPSESKLSPWYSIDFTGKLITPEWRFSRSDLMRFRD
ncbi:MAG: hypothetical protein GF417_07255 [Candidatus Latescibacteria bacterium]|nr:hypothetical protein [bacterium]MBD3424216.1 hypothetical protein [Candidatus Latescibacterota bacterium]